MSQNSLMETWSKILTKEEVDTLVKFQESNNSSIPIIESLKLYEEFINGASCENIAKANPEFALGAIIEARIQHKWDERRDEYLANLYRFANERAMQVQMEAVSYVSDILTATHKLMGSKYKKYIQTGNPIHLEGLDISNPKEYKNTIELLMKLTGQDNKKQIIQKVTIEERSKSKKIVEVDNSKLLKQLDLDK
jgi:hypothetical protein